MPKSHHMSMDEKQTSFETPPNPGRWIGQVVAAVILAEGIWGLLSALTHNVLVPLLARVMEVDPQSPLYLGKGEFNIPALFNSVLTLCLAAIVFVLLREWSQRKRPPVRVIVRASRPTYPTAGPPSIMAPPETAATPIQTPVNPVPVPRISQASISAAPVPVPQQSTSVASVVSPPKPAKPKAPKETYYNIVGEPINPTEND
jgi:hypothetical protein